LRSGLSKALWAITSDNSIYLTFDDGPSEDTDLILDLLKDYQAKATFFLLGEQIERHPEALIRIRQEGHGIGNHGYRHLDGWRAGHSQYLENMEKGKELTGSSDFRPPYGRMSPKQWKTISASERIVMWSHMPGDFDSGMDIDSCYSFIESNLEPGAIIVLHDNAKSLSKVLNLLPLMLSLFKEKGLQMEPLPSR
jgi:peptidoglycan/xylan/chitin deacetylase (PgdA/CDA1 family)